MSRIVTLTELQILFEEQVIPMPTADRAAPEAGPHLVNQATVSTPHRTGAGRRLGTSSSAPIWAWAGSDAARRQDAVPRPHVLPVPSQHEDWPAPMQAMPCTAGALAGEKPESPVTPREVHVPTEILRAMASAAAATGRPESALWAEAARMWLALRAQDDHPQPPAPAAALNPAVRVSRDRCWGAIDILLGDLRAPTRVPAAVAASSTVWDDPAA